MREKLSTTHLSLVAILNGGWNFIRGRLFFAIKNTRCVQFCFLLKVILFKYANFLNQWRIWLYCCLLGSAITTICVGPLLLCFISAINNIVPNKHEGQDVNNMPSQTSSTTTIPINTESSIILFNTTNRDPSNNTWFILNSLTINLNSSNNVYIIDVPIVILRDLPRGHTGWKCTYIFGSEANSPNSCQSTNPIFFSNNTFHLQVPTSVFINNDNHVLENFYCQITVCFTIWSTINNNWYNWDFYDLVTRIDYLKLINVIHHRSFLATKQCIFVYNFVSAFTITDGVYTNVKSQYFQFNFQNFITNYQTVCPGTIIIPASLNVKSVAGSLVLPNISLFTFHELNLSFSTPKTGYYSSEFRSDVYYDLSHQVNSKTQNSSDEYLASNGLHYHYLVPSDLYLNVSFFISTFVNVALTFTAHIILASVFTKNSNNYLRQWQYSDNMVPNSSKAIYRKSYDFNDIQHLIN